MLPGYKLDDKHGEIPASIRKGEEQEELRAEQIVTLATEKQNEQDGKKAQKWTNP